MKVNKLYTASLYFAVASFALANPGVSLAQTASKTQDRAAEKPVAELDKQENLGAEVLDILGIRSEFEKMYPDDAKRKLCKKNVSKELLPKCEKIVQKHLRWDMVEKSMADAFTSQYTPEELVSIINFYRTPAGKAMVEKQEDVKEQMGNVLGEFAEKQLPKFIEEMEELWKTAPAPK